MGEITIVPSGDAEIIVTVGGDTIRIAPAGGGNTGAGGATGPATGSVTGGGSGAGEKPPIFVNPPFLPLIAIPFADRAGASGGMVLTLSARIGSEDDLRSVGETLHSLSRAAATEWHVVLTMPGHEVHLDELRRHVPLDEHGIRVTLLAGRADGG